MVSLNRLTLVSYLVFQPKSWIKMKNQRKQTKMWTPKRWPHPLQSYDTPSILSDGHEGVLHLQGTQ